MEWGKGKRLVVFANDDVAAIGIASFGEAVVLMDENDKVLSNSIFYSDIRGTEEVDDILAAIDKEEPAVNNRAACCSLV